MKCRRESCESLRFSSHFYIRLDLKMKLRACQSQFSFQIGRNFTVASYRSRNFSEASVNLWKRWLALRNLHFFFSVSSFPTFGLWWECLHKLNGILWETSRNLWTPLGEIAKVSSMRTFARKIFLSATMTETLLILQKEETRVEFQTIRV